MVTTGETPSTLVRVPFPVPAPIADLNDTASNALIVLSALILKKVIALGLGKVNKF